MSKANSSQSTKFPKEILWIGENVKFASERYKECEVLMVFSLYYLYSHIHKERIGATVI